jgi:hypothetical protein
MGSLTFIAGDAEATRRDLGCFNEKFIFLKVIPQTGRIKITSEHH